MKIKMRFVGLILLFFFLKISAQSVWNYDYDQALKLSKALNKPILLDFTAFWCGPCKMMEKNVWNRADIKLLINKYIPLKIELDLYTNIARKYHVKSIPNILILDSYGNKLYNSLGYKKKQEVAKFLTDFAVNLGGINRAMFILDKSKENVYSNIRVGQKYQDAGLVLKGNVRKSFLNLSNQFLKKATKLIGNKPKVIEKIELLMLLNKAYLHHNKLVIKTIPKRFKKVDESNEALLTYIKLYVNNDLDQKDKVTALLSDLQHAKNNSGYLNKATFILNNN